MTPQSLLKMVKTDFAMVLLLFFISGCTTVRHAPPDDVSERATVSGMQDIRAFGGRPNDVFIKDLMGLLEKEQKKEAFSRKFSKTYTSLAISGGAENAAYGAGLLNGWSQSGSRPAFDAVTGISAGAIIAPFAFAGSKYDEKLKKLFTHYSTKDILRRKGLLPTLLGNSIASALPLKRLIDQNIDEDLLRDIAQAYREGRRLYAGTTELDSRKLVIWNMGKIASVGNDSALRLFRKIILASASIPGVFPPVYINVEFNNKVYDEMHVDGGISKNVFFIFDFSEGLDKMAIEKGIDFYGIKRELYVILNGYAKTFWKEVPNTLPAIAQQTYDLMATAKSIGDIYQLYSFTNADRSDFNLAYIPSDPPPKQKEFFDPIEMRRLFDLGFKEAVHGYDWKKYPPGLNKKWEDKKTVIPEYYFL